MDRFLHYLKKKSIAIKVAVDINNGKLESSVSEEVYSLYQHLINAWNHRSASGMAEQFTEVGELIGFDGRPELVEQMTEALRQLLA